MPGEHAQCFFPIGRFEHGVSATRQDVPIQSADALLILHDEYRLRSVRGRLHTRFPLRTHRSIFDAGQVDFERRSDFDLAISGAVPAALLDDAVDRREPQTRPLADPFGRVEWIEDPCRHRRRHPSAGADSPPRGRTHQGCFGSRVAPSEFSRRMPAERRTAESNRVCGWVRFRTWRSWKASGQRCSCGLPLRISSVGAACPEEIRSWRSTPYRPARRGPSGRAPRG